MQLTVDEAASDLASALERRQFGFGLLDEALIVARRRGALSDWLPPEGEPACASPLLLHMEDAILALRERDGEIVLPSVRPPAPDATRVTISIAWNAASRRFVIITTPDHGAQQIDRLLASERREKLLLQQQAEAARMRLRVADTLYRDIVECAGDLVLRFRADRRIVFANRRAANFLGVPQDALLNRSIDGVFPSLGQERGQENPWRLDAYAERPASFEMAARDARGAAVWLWWDARFSGPEGGGEFQAVGRDITAVRRLRAEQDKAREAAREAELASQRLRIAHDLHDTLARSIVTLILEMGLVAKTTRDGEARAKLIELQAEARAGLAEARDAITRLRAARRDEDDPKRIVEAFAKRAREKAPLELRADLSLDISALPSETAEVLSRILREALRNIELHACARRVDIDMREQDGAVHLDISDDGVGFDPARPAAGHFGLVGMKERAAAINATLAIVSAPREGAHLSLRAPLGGREPQSNNFGS
jgi:PAS domain S-box-containing protein